MPEDKIDVDAQLSKLADDALDTDGTSKTIEPDTKVKDEGEKKTETDKDEADKHKEESALGRVSSLQSDVDGLKNKFTSVEDKIDILLDAGTQKIEDPNADIAGLDEEFIPTTRKEFNQLLDERDKQKESQAKNYDQKYMGEFTKFKEEEDHDEIIKELKENFNFKTTNDGARDAEMNYLKASRAFYRKKSVSGKSLDTPLKGEKPKGPLGVGSEGEKTMDTGSQALPKLDKHAQDFVDRLGKSDEFVKMAMSEDLGTGLSKNERF